MNPNSSFSSNFSNNKQDLACIKDAADLLLRFKGVLEQLGERELAKLLPWDLGADLQGVAPYKKAQFYSVVFQLINIAEENHYANQRRLSETKGQNTPGLFEEVLHRLRGQGLKGEALKNYLKTIHVEPVLTAHPTEAKRITVLEFHRGLFKDLKQLQNTALSLAESQELEQRIASTLERIWRTGELYTEKPTLKKEFSNILFYLTRIFPDSLTMLDQRLLWAWGQSGEDLTTLSDPANLPRLSLGNWVGGDRDGHPLVTVDFTLDCLKEMRLAAMTLIYNQIKKLTSKLGMTANLQKAPSMLLKAIDTYAEQLGEAGRLAVERNQGEPWRQYLNLLLVKLPVEKSRGTLQLAQGPCDYVSSVELLNDLQLLRRALEEVKAEQIAFADLRRPYRLVKTFGFHLASLDIRQNSDFHDRAMSQILVAAGIEGGANYENWPEEQRRSFIEQELTSMRPFLHPQAKAGPEADEIRMLYGMLADWVNQNGLNGLGAFIVSMTRDLSDLLCLFLFAREAGFMEDTELGPACPLAIVPLLETIEDLEQGPRILKEYLAHPIVKASLELIRQKKGREELVQQVMVGYSDSNKDGGILASQWALYQAQSSMAQVGDSVGVMIRFFHGRGGSIGRGAGPTKSFLESLPPSSLKGSFRMTEQGESINQKYAFRTTASYNLELLTAGVIGQSQSKGSAVKMKSGFESVMEELAQTSAKVYGQLINDPKFFTFFRQATPIDLLEHSRIGSRPARRSGKAGISDLRAIPWVFSWNQSRFLLPSWYGVGSALKALKEGPPDRWELLLEQVRSGALDYLLQNVQRSILLVDTEVMNLYAGLAEDSKLAQKQMERIELEFKDTSSFLAQLLEPKTSGSLRRFELSITLRREGLRQLHKQQIALLRAWRKNPKDQDLLEEALLTVNAIASGIKNTG